LSHAGRFGDKTAQEQSTKVAKTQGDNTPHKTSVPKPPIDGSPQAPSAKKGTYVTSTSTQQPTDQEVNNRQKGTTVAEDKKVVVDPSNSDKKLRISRNIKPKYELAFVTFLQENLDVFA
jgi:hypothetical protein